MEEIVHQGQDGGGLVRPVDGGAELRAVAHAVREISCELFHFSDGIVVRAAIYTLHSSAAILDLVDEFFRTEPVLAQ